MFNEIGGLFPSIGGIFGQRRTDAQEKKLKKKELKTEKKMSRKEAKTEKKLVKLGLATPLKHAKAKRCQRRVTRRQMKIARKVDKITRLTARLDEMRHERLDILKSQFQDIEEPTEKKCPPPQYEDMPPAYEPPAYENISEVLPPSYQEAQQASLYPVLM